MNAFDSDYCALHCAAHLLGPSTIQSRLETASLDTPTYPLTWYWRSPLLHQVNDDQSSLRFLDFTISFDTVSHQLVMDVGALYMANYWSQRISLSDVDDNDENEEKEENSQASSNDASIQGILPHNVCLHQMTSYSAAKLLVQGLHSIHNENNPSVQVKSMPANNQNQNASPMHICVEFAYPAVCDLGDNSVGFLRLKRSTFEPCNNGSPQSQRNLRLSDALVRALEQSHFTGNQAHDLDIYDDINGQSLENCYRRWKAHYYPPPAPESPVLQPKQTNTGRYRDIALLKRGGNARQHAFRRAFEMVGQFQKRPTNERKKADTVLDDLSTELQDSAAALEEAEILMQQAQALVEQAEAASLDVAMKHATEVDTMEEDYVHGEYAEEEALEALDLHIGDLVKSVTQETAELQRSLPRIDEEDDSDGSDDSDAESDESVVIATARAIHDDDDDDSEEDNDDNGTDDDEGDDDDTVSVALNKIPDRFYFPSLSRSRSSDPPERLLG
jgi:hypothetical protein